MYLIGYDIGTSSIKATLMDAATQAATASATCPKKEMAISAPRPGWAEQDPASWWKNVVAATREMLAAANIDPAAVRGIGITYQMHGLVLVDKGGQVLRPSIIWCDSRAVETGRQAAQDLGERVCLEEMLNLPGNFTASKLKWVRNNEPEIFAKVDKMMLPGDYIAMRMTGEIRTTIGGLSEGILWNFRDNAVNTRLMEYYGIEPGMIPETAATFGDQGRLSKAAASELGLATGTPVAYRAGDQPNNALSLNVLEPGEIAATAGTSGVVYGIGETATYDPPSRVNTFAHVNYTSQSPRYGVLLCVNGTGILNSWLKHQMMGHGQDYPEMNQLASVVPVGSEGLCVLPYGNGAERTLGNRNPGATVAGLDFNTHSKAHLLRASQEGIVFALYRGLEIMKDMGIRIQRVRAGHANMFLSPIFSEAFAAMTDSVIELYNTDGSQGAARGAGIGTGVFDSFASAFTGLRQIQVIEPHKNVQEQYRDAYGRWKAVLDRQLG